MPQHNGQVACCVALAAPDMLRVLGCRGKGAAAAEQRQQQCQRPQRRWADGRHLGSLKQCRECRSERGSRFAACMGLPAEKGFAEAVPWPCKLPGSDATNITAIYKPLYRHPEAPPRSCTSNPRLRVLASSRRPSQRRAGVQVAHRHCVSSPSAPQSPPPPLPPPVRHRRCRLRPMPGRPSPPACR